MALPIHDPSYLKRKENNEFKKIHIQHIKSDEHNHYIIKRDTKYYSVSTTGSVLNDVRILPYLQARIDDEFDTMYIWLVVPENHPEIKRSGKYEELCERPLCVVRTVELNPVQVTAILL